MNFSLLINMKMPNIYEQRNFHAQLCLTNMNWIFICLNNRVRVVDGEGVARYAKGLIDLQI